MIIIISTTKVMMIIILTIIVIIIIPTIIVTIIIIISTNIVMITTILKLTLLPLLCGTQLQSSQRQPEEIENYKKKENKDSIDQNKENREMN